MLVNVFISYAHKDRALRDELATHLSNLRDLGVISDWYDGDIVPGTEWEQQILDHLAKDEIILLLISADFMASKYCSGIEMKQAIDRHNAGKARVLPIMLRATDYEGAPFEKLQILPSEAKPVIGSGWTYRDEAWKDVVKGIRRAIKDLQSETAANP
jgi:hypothetical protein